MTENTIEALRVLQLGIEAVKAVGTQVWAVQPTAGKTFVIGGLTYTAVASGADEAGEINVGADLAAWKVNVVAAINGGDAWNDPNPYAVAGSFSGNNLPITARIPGPAGNLVVFTMPTPDSGNSVNGSGFLGATTTGAFTRGTAATPTTRLPVEALAWSAEDENLYKPKVANGVLVRNRGRSVPVHHGTRFSLADQAAIWEALHVWLGMTVSGVPVQTGGAGDPVTLTYTMSPLVNPNLMSATIERQFDNGLGDTIEERATYCMLSKMGLQFAVNEELKLAGGTGFGRKFNTNAITNGLVLEDFEVMVSALSTVFANDAWADVGDTLLAEEVIGWNLSILPGTFPRSTAEGHTDLDFTKHQIDAGERGMDAELTCLLDPSLYAAEQAHALAGDRRVLRFHVDGSGGRLLDIDMTMQHATTGLWAPGVDKGQDILTLPFEDLTDYTNLLQVTLTLPDVPVW